MRHVALFLVFLLTLSGLSQAHAHSAKSFLGNDTYPLTLSTLLAEHVCRGDARSKAEPAPGADVATFPADSASVAPSTWVSLPRAAASLKPDLKSAITSNPARAPPPVL